MKEKKLYGLFERQGKNWIRLHPALEYHKSVAVRIFQNILLTKTMEGKEIALRVIKS